MEHVTVDAVIATSRRRPPQPRDECPRSLLAEGVLDSLAQCESGSVQRSHGIVVHEAPVQAATDLGAMVPVVPAAATQLAGIALSELVQDR